jgi:2-polyprenyl-3-methyl-5-hydroxy-6-metoxy-1,4-benzoquinol methylase
VRRSAAADPAQIAWAGVVVVGAGGGEAAGAAAAALLEAVRGGKGLVVSGAAARAAADSKDYDLLLGRRPPGGGDRDPAPAGEPLRSLVLVRGQSHPVTQCIPDFIHSLQGPPLDLEPSTEVLARSGGGGEPSMPLVFGSRRERGLVLVSLLDLGEGPSAAVAAVVLARACEWAARRRVTVPFEGKVALAAQEPVPPWSEKEAVEKGFYLGREIAPVMSYHGADWLARADREKTEMPERVLDALRLEKGSVVCDLGAGNGYFTLRMARRVGPGGRVLAVEIQKEMLDLLKKGAESEDVHNVEYVLASEDDPGLPENAVDLVLMVDVYHELSRPAPVLAGIRRALRGTGRIALVEYRGEDPEVPIKPLHRMILPQIRAELAAHGFRVVAVEEFLPHQRIVIAAKD